MPETNTIQQYIIERIDNALYALPNTEADYILLKNRLRLTPEQEETLADLHCIEYKALYRGGFRDCARLLLGLLAC